MGTYALRNVVLVHGGFVDGSGWQGVAASHSVCLSQPEAVATLIAQAAAVTAQR